MKNYGPKVVSASRTAWLTVNVLTDDDVVVGGKASPVVLEVCPDVEIVVYPGGGVQAELLVVDRVVVGGKASPVVLDV